MFIFILFGSSKGEFMALKDLYLKIQSKQITEEEFVKALSYLSADEKQIAIKCYAFMITEGRIIPFFADFAKKHPEILQDLKNGCSMTDEAKQRRQSMYEELAKEFGTHGKCGC